MAGYVMRSTVIVPKTVAELEHGQTVAKGTAVDLPDAYGNHLVDWRLATRDDDALAAQEEQIAADAERRAAEEEAQAKAARAEKIAEIIENLPDDAFTQAGLPKTDAIDAAMPEGSDPVSAEERDAVWASMEAET